MIVGDILVIWRVLAIWYNRQVLVCIPLFFWALLISSLFSSFHPTLSNELPVNMLVHAAMCQAGVASSSSYSPLCKSTDLSAPILSILTNLSVMVLTIFKLYAIRDVWRSKKLDKVISLFVLLLESGTLYVVMLVRDFSVTQTSIDTVG